MDNLLENLASALEKLLDSEDNTGCSDDLTVVNKEAIETLRPLLAEIKANIKSPRQKELAKIVQDFKEAQQEAGCQARLDMLEVTSKYGGG